MTLRASPKQVGILSNSTRSCGDSQSVIKSLDAGVLVEIVHRAIAANSNAVADFKAVKTKAA